ncbi:hypothetical protein [Paraliomyxa miuraensis]|uniref:hypothetical protein n=1 Tax=Paraliomyxa miuraensis TaxID=376150 RepID=UPI002254D0F5|nr:hypothetical protein [Paraliomyxa miuraensis]MCX4247577.1 hypothetical protein [Paraliomyxa miuraensis]
MSSPGRAGQRRASATLALALALGVGVATVPVSARAGVTPAPLLFKKTKKSGGLTPEEAAERRAPVQQQGQQMVSAGELTAATILYDGAAQNEGDPVLFLDAADVYLAMAKEEREISSAETAKMRAQTAQDVLYFHLDSASDPDYRLVATEDVSGLLARASALIDDADATIAEIEAEQDAVVAPEAAPKRKQGNGRGLRIAGAGFIGLGVAGLGLGAAGMAIGRINQKRVDDPAVYGTEFDEFDAKGRRGNLLAGVGLAVGGVGLVLGVTLLVIGKRRGKNAGSAPQESPSDEEASVMLLPTGRGLALTGRF